MAIEWQSGCLRITIPEPGPHPLDKRLARLSILAPSESGHHSEISAEGIIGVQLAHLMHACFMLGSGDEDEWIVPNRNYRLHLRRHGQKIEIARYPSFLVNPTDWLTDDGLFEVDFGDLFYSLSAAVEWLVGESPAQEQDDMVPLLVQQWERAWQRFSRLATFRRIRLAMPDPLFQG